MEQEYIINVNTVAGTTFAATLVVEWSGKITPGYPATMTDPGQPDFCEEPLGVVTDLYVDDDRMLNVVRDICNRIVGEQCGAELHDLFPRFWDVTGLPDADDVCEAVTEYLTDAQ